MTEQIIKTDDELQMDQLCKDLANFSAQKLTARNNKINALIGIDRMNTLIAATLTEIKELERKGVKRVEVNLDAPKTPETSPAK